jgi:hypothetical protein
VDNVIPFVKKDTSAEAEETPADGQAKPMSNQDDTSHGDKEEALVENENVDEALSKEEEKANLNRLSLWGEQ